MGMRCLFTCFLALFLCSGYAQVWKGVVQMGMRRTIDEFTSPKEIGVPQVNDTILNKYYAEQLRMELVKYAHFRDSMFIIAKTDTFGIICQFVSMRVKAKNIRLSRMQAQKCKKCLNYLKKELAECKEKAYNDFLKHGIPLQTVQALYRMETLGCGRELNREPPKSVVRRESPRMVFASWGISLGSE